MSDQPPTGVRSVRENLAWIVERAGYAAEHDRDVRETLAAVAKRAETAYAALDRATAELNEWSAMTSPVAGP